MSSLQSNSDNLCDSSAKRRKKERWKMKIKKKRKHFPFFSSFRVQSLITQGYNEGSCPVDRAPSPVNVVNEEEKKKGLVILMGGR